MAKPGRNDRCPCGSGKKYKQCCLSKDEAAEQAVLAEAQAERDARAAEQRQLIREDRAAMLARFADEFPYEDELDTASNAVVDLVNAGKLDDAEAAARALQAHFPDAHDGWDRLGMVYEARGNARAAADAYRQVLAFLRDHPDYTDDDELERLYTGLVAKLDPPAAT